jgi:hypothetical protein
MIPDHPPEGRGGAGAEAILYRALQDQLDDEFFVYHGLRYVDPRDAHEGEADFVVVHRELGMLVIECKGSGVVRTHSGKWVRGYGDGRTENLRVSPFDQAQDQVHDLARLLLERIAKVMPGRAERFPFIYGHAAAFPKALKSDVNLPLDIPVPIVMDAADLRRVGEKVVGALRFWSQGHTTPKPLSPKEFRIFRRRLLMPEFRVVPSLGARLHVDGQQFLRLTKEQIATLQGALENNRLWVTGGAGTGKTVLAMETARMFASRGEAGQRVLFTCYNKHLARHLQDSVDRWDTPGTIKVRHFHSVCIAAYHALGREPVFPDKHDKEASKRFWNDEAPMTLMEAIESGAVPRWDAIVVDEGQDFAESWWSAVEDLLTDRETSPMVVFYDASQDIFGRCGDLDATAARFRLRFNFRNTRAITEVVRQLGNVDMEPHPLCPEGEPPIVHQQAGANRARRKIDDLIKRMVQREGVKPDQIAILTPHSRAHSCLADVDQIAGVALASDPGKREGKVLHTTIGAFKGLEADVLVLADADPQDERCTLNARYVAASRACHVLHVFARGDWTANL